MYVLYFEEYAASKAGCYLTLRCPVMNTFLMQSNESRWMVPGTFSIDD